MRCAQTPDEEFQGHMAALAFADQPKLRAIIFCCLPRTQVPEDSCAPILKKKGSHLYEIPSFGEEWGLDGFAYACTHANANQA